MRETDSVGSQVIRVGSYVAGDWVQPTADARTAQDAVTGKDVALVGHGALDFQAMLDHGRLVGGPALRSSTFHDRACALKALATYLNERKEELYSLSFMTGATRKDSWVDIDGGIGTLFAYASKGRRELPEAHTYVDGDVEALSRGGTFIGQHIYTPKKGVAVHINAFNFPVWGMLEKLAPSLLAGLSAIVKPATATSYVTEACFRMMVESEAFPEGSFQLVCGGMGDLLDRLTGQDSVAFTGSADTALMLKSNPHLLRQSIPFNAEQDSLNATVLGEDVTPDAPEFDLFAREVVQEMTTKAGQKCTAIRRIFVPQTLVAPMAERIREGLGKIRIGDPRLDDTTMGALVSQAQRQDVEERIARLAGEARFVCGGDGLTVIGADKSAGAFVAPTLF
ncbi:MAG: aldehyde dehydrogenase family protein, partial [Pseudomonadota bacterium]